MMVIRLAAVVVVVVVLLVALVLSAGTSTKSNSNLASLSGSSPGALRASKQDRVQDSGFGLSALTCPTICPASRAQTES